jgi:hypothetical protein
MVKKVVLSFDEGGESICQVEMEQVRSEWGQ